MNRKTLSAFIFFMLLSLNKSVAQDDPELIFREDWKEIEAQFPINQEHVANPDLLLYLYGPGRDSIRKSKYAVSYLFTGYTHDLWAATLKHKSNYINLAENGRIRWRAKQEGFRHLHIILKLANGQWIISEQADDESGDWRIKEFITKDIRWREFDPVKIAEGSKLDQVDLTKVDEVGITDLRYWGKSRSCSRLDWIEVYGTPVER